MLLPPVAVAPILVDTTAMRRGLCSSTKGLCRSRQSKPCVPIEESSLYLKQALRAWYDMLLKFLLSQEFSKSAFDPTLLTRKECKDILLIQIYVDDIIFAFTDPALCDVFAKIIDACRCV
ncbi:retrovirus-related pol polyprotein from transposon TNT 1-94 [Tanacetum coccineum]